MKRLAVALFVFPAAAAFALDVSDCSNAARRLKREARDLEDMADNASMLQGDDAAKQQAEIRSKASDVSSAARKVERQCESPQSRYPVAVVREQIGLFLVQKFGATPATRERLSSIKEGLDNLAKAHVRAGAGEFNMTFAMAEALFRTGSNE